MDIDENKALTNIASGTFDVSAVEVGTNCAICDSLIPCHPLHPSFPICMECRKRMRDLLYPKEKQGD